MTDEEDYSVTNKRQRASVWISLVLTWAVLVGLVAVALCLPLILPWYLRFTQRSMELVLLLWALLYATLVPAAVAGVSLLKLLQNVRGRTGRPVCDPYVGRDDPGAPLAQAGQSQPGVFQPSSARYLRVLSWCCFAECFVFLALTPYFAFSPIIAFAAAFIGLMLRVVKSVIEEGTRIKSENDFTV